LDLGFEGEVGSIYRPLILDLVLMNPIPYSTIFTGKEVNDVLGAVKALLILPKKPQIAFPPS
jgi:hypothetical protein